MTHAHATLRVLRRLIDRLGPQTAHIGGSVAFDAGSEGAWVVDLETPGGAWNETASRQDVARASVCIQGDPQAIASLFEDTQAVASLLTAGRLRVIGDGKRLIELGEALQHQQTQALTFH